MNLTSLALKESIESYFKEDDLDRNLFYINSLPKDEVQCQLKIKDDMVLAGLPWFVETFKIIGANFQNEEEILSNEGKAFKKKDKFQIEFSLPFNIALTGERIALNLLQKASSIATFTNQHVKKAKAFHVKILDTRKTTPGHRALEKYAVRVGGGFNHRLGQTDVWMIKDNHKNFFGGIKKAVEFFKSQQSFYAPIEVEIHDLKELKVAQELGIKHLMLDNFSPEQIKEAIGLKKEGVTFEASGGIHLANLDHYLISGLDAISIGRLTYGAPPVDISLKYNK